MSDSPRYYKPGFVPNSKPVSELYIQALAELVTPPPSTPLVRFPSLQKAIGGLRPNEFTLFCGSTGTGKTTLMANLSADLMAQGVKHFVASVETGWADFIKRGLSCFAREDLNRGDSISLEKARALDAEYGKHFRSSTLELALYDSRIPIKELLATLEYFSDLGHKVAIIDNLNFLLDVQDDRNATRETDNVIHELVVLCKRVPMHVIMLCHPRKTDDNRVEDPLHIKGSSTAAQEASNVLLLNHPHPYALEQGLADRFHRELLIGKVRRRGRYVNTRILFNSTDGATYTEGETYVLPNNHSTKTRR